MHTLIKPVFLVGAMRSGTTLLADLLGESNLIVHCPFELKDIWSAVGGVQMACPKTRDELCHELGAQDVKPGQREKLTAAFMERMSAVGGNKAADAVFLNKNPHLCNKLPLVDALFPDASFIWIYRKLPSVVSSLDSLFDGVNRRQQTWHYWPKPQTGTVNRCWHTFHFTLPDGIDMSRCFPGGDVRYLAEYWLECNRAVASFFEGLPPERQLIVQEEVLIERPITELERCLRFLGLNPSVRADVCGTIDTKRNIVWGSNLSEQSLQHLFEFVKEHIQVIDSIFIGKNYTTEYLTEIRQAIDYRRGTSTKNGQKVISEQLVEKFSVPKAEPVSTFQAVTAYAARPSNGWRRVVNLLFSNKGLERNHPTDNKLIIGCVTENSPKYLSQTLRLLQSLRWFGGKIANAPFRVCSIEGIEETYKRQFEEYGATVRIVSRYDAKCPVTNKIRFLQQDDIHDYETVMLLDCDTIIVQDPSQYLSENIFKAKIADLPTMPHENFTVLFNFFGITLPSQIHSCTVSGEPTIAYLNTGVLIFPKGSLLTIVPEWITYTNKLLQNIELIKGLEHYCEQASMSIALAVVGEQFKALGNEMNFPTHHVHLAESQLLHNVDPVIIHYHFCFSSDGYIDTTRYPLVNKRIIQFNNRLRQEREKAMKSGNSLSKIASKPRL